MAKKKKNLKKQNIKKAQKQKKRREKLKQQSPPQQGRAGSDLLDRVDMALQLIREGDLRTGKKILERLEEKYEDSFAIPAVHYGLGVAAITEERYSEAASYFEKTVAVAPDLVEAYLTLAFAYKMQHKMPEMVQALRQVAKRGKRGSHEVTQAKEMLNGLENILKDDGLTLDEYLETAYFFEHGMYRMESGDWEEALQSFEKGLDLFPNDPRSYGNMGLCYAFLGKREQALDAVDRALALDPDDEPAHLIRVFVNGMKEGERLGERLNAIKDSGNYRDGEEERLLRDYLEEQGFLPGKNEPARQNPPAKKRESKKKAASPVQEKKGLRFSQYRITDEPLPEPVYDRLPKDVKDRIQELMVTAQKNPIRAIPELQELKEKYPDVPNIYNFLAVAYSTLGDQKKAEAVIRENLAKHPDYLFGKLNYAQICIAKEAYEKIPEIFDNKFDLKMICPERDTFHITEFVTFCGIMGKYYFWTGQIDAARQYNKSLQEAAPETRDARELNRLLNSKEAKVVDRMKKLFGR